VNRRYGILWACWLGIAVLWFGIAEYFALVDPRSGDTLSEWFRWALSIPAVGVPLSILWIGGIVWLTLHFFKDHRW